MKVINQGVRSEHDYGKEGGRDYDGGKMKMTEREYEGGTER